MKKCIFFLLVLSNMALASSFPKLDFFKTLGSSGDDGAYDLVVDKYNNIFVLGWYTGSLDLDPSNASYLVNGFGSRDIFVAKYDSLGSFQWGFGLGSFQQDEGSVITLDSTGNVIIAGRFSGSVDFNPGPNSNFRVSNGNRDIYLAKYDSLGSLLWVNSMGGAIYDDAEDVIVDTLGNIYLTGSFQGTVDFDPGVGIDTRVSNGLDDAYLACYSPSGNFIWVNTFGGNMVDDFSGIKLDGNGFIYGAGLFSGLTDFDGGVGVFNITSIGNNDIFIVKYNLNGDFQWAKSMGGSGFDAAYGIEISNDNLYLSGTFSDSVDFDPSIGSTIKLSQGAGDIYLCKFDTGGNFIWVNTAGGVGNDIGMDVGVDQFGFIISTGMFRLNSTFTGGGTVGTLVALGDRDIYLDRFDSTGRLIHAFPISSVGVENSHTFYLDKKNNAIYISGFYGGVADFDPSPLINSATNFSGITDIFFAKYIYVCDSLSPLQFIYGNSIVCEGDTLTYHVDSLTTCDECIWLFPNGSLVLDSLGSEVSFVAGSSDGILEVYKINSCFETPSLYFPIQINDRSISFINDSICSGMSYVFPDGTFATTDTIQSSFLTSQFGCDSIIVTNLKFMLPITIEDSVVLCNGSQYSFFGINYSLTGLYFHTISTPGFCDTIHSLMLSILPANLVLQNKTLCFGDTLWVGSVAHTTGGIVIDTLISSLTCDSIVISNVNLIILDTTITTSNGVYTSNQSNAVYQWYECGSVLTPIPNAIFQSYTVPLNGSYAVSINVNGCIDTTNCINTSNTAVININSDKIKVVVMPNPVVDYLYVSSVDLIIEVFLYSIDGKLLISEVVNDTFYNLNLNSFNATLYTVVVKTKSSISQFRISKL